jgi:hypothetical protein
MNAQCWTHVFPAGRNGIMEHATQTRPTSTVSLRISVYRTKLEQEVYEPDRVSNLDRAKMRQNSVGQEQEGCDSPERFGLSVSNLKLKYLSLGRTQEGIDRYLNPGNVWDMC